MADLIPPSLSADEWRERLHRAIPGGAHTYSRGDDQFPRNAPPILVRGKGALVWDAAGRQASVGEVVRTVVGRFRVDGQTARLDVARFVGELQQAGLVELLPAEAEGPLDASASASGQPGGPVGGGA